MQVTAFIAAAALLGYGFAQQNFTIYNGQIYTPGFVIVDAPQPYTPLGGDTLEVAIDVTADGILPLDVASGGPSGINNITMFLYSYVTGRNFTISNGTVSGTTVANNATLGPIMSQEPGSTVKHVKWTWPACMTGDGSPMAQAPSDRGAYNISIHQNFRINQTQYYTIFDLPISVTNSIRSSIWRPDCNSINNALLTPSDINVSASALGVQFAPGGATQVQLAPNGTNSTGGQNGTSATSVSANNSGPGFWSFALLSSLVLLL